MLIPLLQTIVHFLLWWSSNRSTHQKQKITVVVINIIRQQ